MRLLVPLLLLALAGPASAAFNVATSRYHVAVDGEVADGWLSYPTDVAPTTLLVFGHGCCGKPDQSAFVRAYAQTYGAAVVAMDYRGPGGWDVMKGHRDLIAATEDLQARFEITRTLIWGISMGGETTGMAVAARPDLYDYWVDTFGVTNLFEEYATLGHYGGLADQGAIWRETGGPPILVPEEYRVRSPALRTSEMVGITRAYIAHGVGDLIVPYTMSRETYEGLVAAGVPVTLHTVTTGPGGTQTFYGSPAGTLPTPVGLAAHDGRGGAPSYGVVHQLLLGNEPDAGVPFREHVVDYTAGQTASLP